MTKFILERLSFEETLVERLQTGQPIAKTLVVAKLARSYTPQEQPQPQGIPLTFPS